MSDHQLTEEEYKAQVAGVWKVTVILSIVTVVEVAAALILGPHLPKWIMNPFYAIASIAKAFFIIGHYKALGFSPFSIENADGKVKEALGKSYDIINQVSEILFNRKWLSYDGLLVDKKDGA